MKPGISAIVIAHNQLELLEKCLHSLSTWVDQIVLVDLESTDDIQGLAARYKVDYVLHTKVAIVEEVRQESLKYATEEYVIFLDPDETITPTLSQTLLSSLSDQPAYIKIPRQNYVFGKWIEHSQWWPDYQIRLFKKSAMSWPTDLHAQPEIQGDGITLDPLEKNAITHLNYLSIDQWNEKNNRYAKTEALEYLQKGVHFTLAAALKKSIGQIIDRFFAGEGYKDGLHGLVLSIFQSFYYFMVYAYYWEAKKFAQLESDSTIRSFPRTWFSHGLSEVMYWDKAKSPLRVIKEKLVRKMIG